MNSGGWWEFIAIALWLLGASGWLGQYVSRRERLKKDWHFAAILIVALAWPITMLQWWVVLFTPDAKKAKKHER